MKARQGVSVLGSTGSIGIQALEVISHYGDRFRVEALTAGSNMKLLERQVAEYRPRLVAVGDENAAIALDLKSSAVAVRRGIVGLVEAASLPEADIVINGLSGAVGLEPTLAALDSGHRLALANKESLVMAGPLVIAAAERRGSELIPVDSEHSAIFQCLGGKRAPDSNVKKIWLTASGGPFRDWTAADIETASKEEALSHPTWNMGEKITVDSATLMNKGLEVIEAYWLFGLAADQIEVVIHPQSIVHSMVEFVDGSILAQLSRPDMKLPIQAALFHPERPPYPFTQTDPAEIGPLAFSKPDRDRFPSLGLAYRALAAGGTAPAVLNAANEVAVDAFLKGRIRLGRIPEIIDSTLARHKPVEEPDLKGILAADAWAREVAEKLITETIPEARSRK